MAKRQNQWATRARAELVQQLGGECVECQAIADLTLDVLFNSDPRHHGMSHARRLSYYRQEWRKGNLAIRCRECHGKQAKEKAAGVVSKRRQSPGRERVIRLLSHG